MTWRTSPSSVIKRRDYNEVLVSCFHIKNIVCMRHLWKNLKKTYPSDFFERVVEMLQEQTLL